MAPRSWERQHNPSGHTPLDHTTASTHHLVLKSANRLTQTMKKQLHFRNQPLTTKRPTYYKPSTWTPPKPNFTNLTMFLEQSQNLISNPPPRATRPNLSSQQRSTLKKSGSSHETIWQGEWDMPHEHLPLHQQNWGTPSRPLPHTKNSVPTQLKPSEMIHP